jgi:hypothetical protein
MCCRGLGACLAGALNDPFPSPPALTLSGPAPHSKRCPCHIFLEPHCPTIFSQPNARSEFPAGFSGNAQAVREVFLNFL